MYREGRRFSAARKKGALLYDVSVLTLGFMLEESPSNSKGYRSPSKASSERFENILNSHWRNTLND